MFPVKLRSRKSQKEITAIGWRLNPDSFAIALLGGEISPLEITRSLLRDTKEYSTEDAVDRPCSEFDGSCNKLLKEKDASIGWMLYFYLSLKKDMPDFIDLRYSRDNGPEIFGVGRSDVWDMKGIQYEMGRRVRLLFALEERSDVNKK